MKIFNGKKASKKILLDLKRKIEKKGVSCRLAIILVGSNLESKLYIRNKKRAAEEIGVKVSCYDFRGNVREEKIIKKIYSLNKDNSVNGIIVQLPLPKKFNTAKIMDSIDPYKDVDGFHKVNRELLLKGRPYFFPVLSLAIFFALKKGLKDMKKKKILALTNSDIFGETLRDFFERKGVKIKYLIKKEEELAKIKNECRKTDALITILGQPRYIKGEMIKKGAVLIDAGIRVLPSGKLRGDMDRKSVFEKASFLTPTPGGIGPLTVAFLLKNIYLSTI